MNAINWHLPSTSNINCKNYLQESFYLCKICNISNINSIKKFNKQQCCQHKCRFYRILKYKNSINNLINENTLGFNYLFHNEHKKNSYKINKLQYRPLSFNYWMLRNSSIILLFYFVLFTQNFEMVYFSLFFLNYLRLYSKKIN